MTSRGALALLLLVSGCYAHGFPFDDKVMCGKAYPISRAECAALQARTGASVMDAGVVDAAPSVVDAAPSADAELGDTGAAASVVPCKRKGGRSPDAPDDIEIGCTTAEVIAAEGQPSKRESDAVWLYLFPRRCSDFRVHVTVQFAQGRVVKVTRKRKYTGELCEPVE